MPCVISKELMFLPSEAKSVRFVLGKSVGERREELNDQLLADDKAIMCGTKMDRLVPYDPLEREKVRREKGKVKETSPRVGRSGSGWGFVGVVGVGLRTSSMINWTLTTIADNTLKEGFRKSRAYNYP